MTSPRRSRRRRTKKPAEEGKLPLSVANREGKTTVRNYGDRKFVRIGEVRGKVVAHVELYTSKQDSHSLTIRFKDQTALNMAISPGFTISAEYYKRQGLADPRVLKRWPQISSEQLP